MEDHDDEMMERSLSLKRIAILSLAHACVDFVCAFSLYRHFQSLPQAFLFYNFCAFALQMPIGLLIDIRAQRKKEAWLPGMICVFLGIFLTLTGSFLSEILTGLGNAFFHAGGGVLVIREDKKQGMKGSGLGVFVAPGALGLILGCLYYATPYYDIIFRTVSIGLLISCLLLWKLRKKEKWETEIRLDPSVFLPLCLCFLVVVLRSLTGMAISFPWKYNHFLTILSVIALASGKTAGGFLAARCGMKKTILLTLSVSAVCYLFADQLIFGMLALFFFNMTMPLTLYLLAEKMPAAPGFAFGILTFALFIGYLPVLYGFLYQLPPFPMGTIASLLSLILLLLCIKENRNA